jgi:hypothetical protein
MVIPAGERIRGENQNHAHSFAGDRSSWFDEKHSCNVDEDDSADMIGRETEHAAKSKL